MSTDQPCTWHDAVRRAQSIAATKTGQYGYGTGDYSAPFPTIDSRGRMKPDLPWTGSRDAEHPGPSSDCAGFAICYCWMLKRHRPGFNNGSWASVSDDINCNSAIEDAQHKQELFTMVGFYEAPRPGDLLTYPTFQFGGKEFIGHVAIIEDVPADYKPGEGWHRLSLIQCHGPNGFKPGAVRTDGSGFDLHDHNWPKPEHRCKVVRPKERP